MVKVPKHISDKQFEADQRGKDRSVALLAIVVSAVTAVFGDDIRLAVFGAVAEVTNLVANLSQLVLQAMQ